MIVCLLLARNAATQLPRYLDSVERFADALVVSDVGSTDDTRSILATHPLAKIVLEGDAEDAEGHLRDRLLAAAGELEPDWIISLDADERFSPDDALALRHFVEGGLGRDHAYGFTIYRMTADGAHYDRVGPWVVRLFAYQGDQRFRDVGLQGAMVPAGIPKSQWIRTTLRLQHFPSPAVGEVPGHVDATERYPFGYPRDDDWQAPYRPPRAPTGIRAWTPRRSARRIVPPSDVAGRSPNEVAGRSHNEVAGRSHNEVAGRSGAGDSSSGSVVLSAIVISQNDEDRIERCVRSVVEQSCPEPFEVIVVTIGSDRTAEIVREQFPMVSVVELGRPALPGEARNAGLSVARGEYISFPGSHVTLPPGSLAARIRAHDLGFAMVTGSILNGAQTPAGSASYFLDHFLSLPGHPSRQLGFAPSHCSYTHEALLEVGGFPDDRRTGEDTLVNQRLFLVGHAAYRSSELELFHRSPCETARQLAKHHFKRGVGYSTILVEAIVRGEQPLNRALIRRLSIDYLPLRLRSINNNVEVFGTEVRAEYRRAFPLIALGATAAWVGIWSELIRSSRGRVGEAIRQVWRAYR